MAVVKKHRAKPKEEVMVWDRMKTDITGGNRTGMKTVLFRWNKRCSERITSAEEHPISTVKSFSEMPDVLDEILEREA